MTSSDNTTTYGIPVLSDRGIVDTRYSLKQLENRSKRYASVLKKVIFLLFLVQLLDIQQGGHSGVSQVCRGRSCFSLELPGKHWIECPI
ncbi:hypothetical protein CYMTET_43403 [Cymbomonas tetramitiformis]|uniref:Uncharacterized protein n=1 Tax=Cymbomonas tetramitiformis TaxID=36881 RepID=A0AAE0C2B6_9CHLO|nr:hypothetical protein CYMTET_43403 [Cymbomonas tetramitiformis]